MKKIFLLILLLLLPNIIWSVEPVSKVGELPGDNQLEAYEMSEELFVSKVMEYYNASLVLSTQIKMLGEKAIVKIPAPSLEDLNDMELDIIIKYHNIAKKLQSQVEGINKSNQMQNYLKMKTEIEDVKTKYMDSLWSVRNGYLLRELAIKKSSDSTYFEEIQRIDSAYKNGCADCVDFLAVSVFNNIFMPSSSEFISDPNMGLKISINALKMFGYGSGLEFYYEYQSPKFSTRLGTIESSIEDSWNSDLSVLGLNSEFYPLFSNGNVNSGIKFGLGYFWSRANIINKNIGNYDWKGMKLELEYFAGLKYPQYPFELFVNASLYQGLNSRLRVYHGYEQFDNINLGYSLFGISFGLRYNFWSSSY